MPNLFVRVSFPTGNQLYTYRTPTPLNVKSYVVVPTPRGFAVGKVHSMLNESKVDLDVPYEYKWTVQPIDFTEYHANKSSDAGVSRL